MVDSVLTAWPDAPVSLMAGAPVGDEPAAATDTWKEGPAVGAGVQRKAHPMFQPDAVTVKAGLVQLPWDWVGPRSSCAGAAVVEVVEEVPVTAPEVVVEEDAPVVVVDEVPAPEAVELVDVDPLDPAGGGGV